MLQVCTAVIRTCSTVDNLRDCRAHAKICAVRRRGIAPIALILLGAVACTSGSGGNTSAPHSTVPPSSTSPVSSPAPPSSKPATPTPTVATTGPNVRPGEKPPTYPAISRTNTRSGALAFVGYWIDTLDWGYATTDSTLAKLNYLPTCDDCARFMKNFDDAKSKNEHFRGGRVSIDQATLDSSDTSHPGTSVIDVTFSVARLVTLDMSNAIVTTAPAISSLTYRTWAAWTGRKWAVAFEKQVAP